MRFPARQYLNHYYTEIGTENDKLMLFYARIRNRIPQNAVHLEIGSGPTLYQLISIAPRIKKIIYTDASIGALRQLRKWIDSEKDAFNWDQYFERAIVYEKGNATKEEISKRKKILRKIDSKFLKRDLSSIKELEKIGNRYRTFQSISSNFAYEAIVYKKQDFQAHLKEMYKILDKGGVFNIIMVESCKAYQIGNKYLKTLDITKEDLISLLVETGFDKKRIVSDYEQTENEDFGYKGIMFYSCIK